MNLHRILLWLVLVLGLTACSGQAVPASDNTPYYTPAAAESTATVTPTVVSTNTATAAPTIVSPSPTLAPTDTPVLAPEPSATPVASPTVPPTATFTVTPTLLAILTATPSPLPPTPTAALATHPDELGPPDMVDPMDIPGKHWYLWGNAYVRPQVRPGVLGLIVPKTSNVTYWIRSNYPPLQDAYVQAIFKTGDVCHHKDRYGLVVRASEKYDEGIFVLISCDGMYKIFRWNSGLKILHDWERTPAIHTGRRQINRVGVWMEGPTLRLYVNGSQVAEVQDDHFTEGVFGLAVGADATPGFTVYVDEVAYWILPKPAQGK